MEKQLQLRVKNYFEYLFEENMTENEQAENILNTLCSSLKHDVCQNKF